jgi:hypothetical protein
MRRLAILGNLLLIILVLPLHGPVGSPALRIAEETVKHVKDPSSAGYEVNYTSVANSVDDLKGRWNVPTVQPSTERTAVLESISIGSGDTYIQVGTSQVSHNGAVVYGAWYWVSPEGGSSPTAIHQLDGKVGPGRAIGVEIKRESGSAWVLGIISITANASPDIFQTQITHAAGLPAAGWLLQPIPDYPLANFGSLGFYATNATIDGTELRLDQLQNERVTLVDSSQQCGLAVPGDIDPSNGDNFIVSFIQSAGPCSTQNTSNIPSFGLLLPLLIGGIVIVGVIVIVVALVIVSTRKKHGPAEPFGLRNLGPPVAPSAPRLCANCGTPLQPGGRFCDACGKPVV